LVSATTNEADQSSNLKIEETKEFTLYPLDSIVDTQTHKLILSQEDVIQKLRPESAASCLRSPGSNNRILLQKREVENTD
jgi:hypothetical protein